MNERIGDAYERLRDDAMSRRSFFDQVARIAGGATALAAFAPFARAESASAQTVPPEDPRLSTLTASYEVNGTKMSGYLARMKEGGKRPAVIVIHENRGLNAHIQDVARRFALEGFLAFAPDILSPYGGTPQDEAKMRELFGQLNAAESVARLAGAVPFLAKHPDSNGKVGVVGFCWGGGMANRVAAAAGPALHAAAPYYGATLPAEEVPKVSAPLLLHYAGNDARINAGIPAFEAALKANNKTYQIHMYEGADHAFNNDTNPPRYNKAAAELAWSRTVAFFKKYLS